MIDVNDVKVCLAAISAICLFDSRSISICNIHAKIERETVSSLQWDQCPICFFISNVCKNVCTYIIYTNGLLLSFFFFENEAKRWVGSSTQRWRRRRRTSEAKWQQKFKCLIMNIDEREREKKRRKKKYTIEFDIRI